MKKRQLKYRITVFALSVLYLNFFIFSTFHHHHDSEKSNFHVEGEMLFCNIDVECCDDDIVQDLVNDSHHSHNFEICFINTVFSKENNKLADHFDSFSTTEYIIGTESNNSSNNVKREFISQYHWSKIVQSATNVSPPLT
jgi:hypothetical protein